MTSPSWKRVGLETLLIAGFVGGVAQCNGLPKEEIYNVTIPFTLMYGGWRTGNKIVRELIDRYKNGRWPYDDNK